MGEAHEAIAQARSDLTDIIHDGTVGYGPDEDRALGILGAMFDVVEAAQADGRRSCIRVPEKVPLSRYEMAEIEAACAGSCSPCRFNAALAALDLRVEEERA